MSTRRPSRWSRALLVVALTSMAIVSALPDPRWSARQVRSLLGALGLCCAILAGVVIIDGGRGGR